MANDLIQGVLNESRWPALAMAVAALVITLSWRRLRRSAPSPSWAEGVLDVAFGCLVGVMAFGHLLAVTIHLVRGDTLRSPPALLYLIGLVLMVPAAWLVVGTIRSAGRSGGSSRTPIRLNVWLVIALLASGPHNGPLALPAVLRLVHAAVTRQPLRWMLAGLAAACYVALLVGSVVFAASGQSFEQFSGME